MLAHRCTKDQPSSVPGGHVMEAVRDHVGTPLNLHDNCLGVGHLVPVLQPWKTIRSHHLVNLRLYAALHLRLTRHVEQGPRESVGGEQA